MALDEYARYITLNNQKQVVIQRISEMYNDDMLSHLHKSCFVVAKVEGEIVGELSSVAGYLVPKFNRNIAYMISKYGSNLDIKQVNKVQKDIMMSREAEDDEYYIDTLSVDANYRGQGISKHLITYAYDEARTLNMNKVVLVVNQNKVIAKAVYEKLGFKVCGEWTSGGLPYLKMIKTL